MLSYSWIPKPSGHGSFQNILPPSNHQLIFQNSYLSRPCLVKPFLPPQRGRTTPLFCFHHHTLHSTLLFQHLLYRGVTTLGVFFNHVSTFDRSWRAGSSSNPSPSPGTQPGEHAEYIYKRKASWSQGLLSLPSCTLHQRLSSYSAFLKSPTNSVFWKNQVPKKFNALCTPELNIFFIVKTHFPVKGVD